MCALQKYRTIEFLIQWELETYLNTFSNIQYYRNATVAVTKINNLDWVTIIYGYGTLKSGVHHVGRCPKELSPYNCTWPEDVQSSYKYADTHETSENK